MKKKKLDKKKLVNWKRVQDKYVNFKKDIQ